MSLTQSYFCERQFASRRSVTFHRFSSYLRTSKKQKKILIFRTDRSRNSQLDQQTDTFNSNENASLKPDIRIPFLMGPKTLIFEKCLNIDDLKVSLLSTLFGKNRLKNERLVSTTDCFCGLLTPFIF